jgi:hypothetical protein
MHPRRPSLSHVFTLLIACGACTPAEGETNSTGSSTAGAATNSTDSPSTGAETTGTDGPLDATGGGETTRHDSTGESPTSGPGPEEPGAVDGAAVFDLSMLHRVELTVAPGDLPTLENDPDAWVQATLSLDGGQAYVVGLRKKGGINSLQPLDGKPAFSVKVGQFVADQTIDGLGRLVLNNSVQDEGLLSEHLGYEVARRAGIAAPRTSHGVVVLNGQGKGIYVLKELINKNFLRDAFGSTTTRATSTRARARSTTHAPTSR